MSEFYLDKRNNPSPCVKCEDSVSVPRGQQSAGSPSSHQRAWNLALENPTVRSLLKDAPAEIFLLLLSSSKLPLNVPKSGINLTLIATKGGKVNQVLIAANEEIERVARINEKGMSFTEVFFMISKLLEIFVKTTAPKAGFALVPAKIATAFATAYIYHRYIEG